MCVYSQYSLAVVLVLQVLIVLALSSSSPSSPCSASLSSSSSSSFMLYYHSLCLFFLLLSVPVQIFSRPTVVLLLLGRFSWVSYIMFRVCMSVCLSYETACRAGLYVCTYGAILRIRLTEEYYNNVCSSFVCYFNQFKTLKYRSRYSRLSVALLSCNSWSTLIRLNCRKNLDGSLHLSLSLSRRTTDFDSFSVLS